MSVNLDALKYPVFEFKEGIVSVSHAVSDFKGSPRVLKRWYPGVEIIDASLKRYRVEGVQVKGGVGPLWGILSARLLGRLVYVDLVLRPLPGTAIFEEVQKKVLRYVVKTTNYSRAELKVVREKIRETRTIADLADAMQKAFSGAWFPDFKQSQRGQR